MATSGDIQKLRAITGAGIMDCKNALVASNGDFDKAIQILREKGAASAAKRAGRSTGDGLVTSYITSSGKSAVLLELSCETDFVARTDDFQKLLNGLAEKAGNSSTPWKSADDAPQSEIKEAAAKLGENIALRPNRFVRYDQEGKSVFSVYIHPSGGVGKVGVLLELVESEGKNEVLSSEDVKMLGKDLAMQVAATNPRWIKKEDVPENILEEEKNIAREHAKRDNKPEKIWDRIVTGKLQQFYQQFCLLDQAYVKDAGGKTKISDLIAQISKKAGGNLLPKRFIRLKVGEE